MIGEFEYHRCSANNPEPFVMPNIFVLRVRNGFIVESRDYQGPFRAPDRKPIVRQPATLVRFVDQARVMKESAGGHDLAPVTWPRPAVIRGFQRQRYVTMGAMTTPPSPPSTPVPPPAEPWVERWLSQPRHAVYLAAAAGDPQPSLDLYEWNAEISSALLRDLAYVEVGLRNAYDRALSARWPGPPHWTAATIPPFAPLYRTRRGRRVDVNVRTRESLQRAVDSAGGPAAAPGKVVAELMFGFWRFLSSTAHEKTLWVPALHHAFAPGTDRRDVDRPIGRLHGLRNRVAHHEPLLSYDIAGRVTDAVNVATLIDAELGQHLAATSQVGLLLVQRPR